MTMVTKSAHRKACDSFVTDIPQKHNNIIPPWCSSGKVPEKKKLSSNWEIQSSYPLRENIWEYLYDGENLKCRSKKRNRRTNKHEKSCRKKTKLILFLFLCMAGVIGSLWKLYPTKSSKLLTKLLAKSKLLPFDLENSSVNEECNHKMRHLTLELYRAERILRNTFRHRMTIMFTPGVKTEKSTIIDSRYIDGALAVMGAGTEEWSGRVILWGLVPLWRAAPPPDTVLALRNPTPADCWPFRGSSGELHIQLPRIQRVQSISIEHVRPDTARSAPKRFVVYGRFANNTEIEVLSSEYRQHGPAKQYFSIGTKVPMQGLTVNVLTNYGNLKYTCIYRVHVYGNEEVENFDD